MWNYWRVEHQKVYFNGENEDKPFEGTLCSDKSVCAYMISVQNPCMIGFSGVIYYPSYFFLGLSSSNPNLLANMMEWQRAVTGSVPMCHGLVTWDCGMVISLDYGTYYQYIYIIIYIHIYCYILLYIYIIHIHLYYTYYVYIWCVYIYICWECNRIILSMWWCKNRKIGHYRNTWDEM